MKMSGEYRISAPRQIVWDVLNDPAILKNCLPGCERLETTSDSAFEAIITTKVGLVKMTFVSSLNRPWCGMEPRITYYDVRLIVDHETGEIIPGSSA